MPDGPPPSITSQVGAVVLVLLLLIFNVLPPWVPCCPFGQSWQDDGATRWLYCLCDGVLAQRQRQRPPSSWCHLEITSLAVSSAARRWLRKVTLWDHHPAMTKQFTLVIWDWTCGIKSLFIFATFFGQGRRFGTRLRLLASGNFLICWKNTCEKILVSSYKLKVRCYKKPLGSVGHPSS